MSVTGMVFSLVFATAYMVIRPRFRSDMEYSVADRALHRLALQFTPIRDICFDIDQQFSDPDINVAAGRHVFIAGLARAGTTILMRRFYATGFYRSLLYRDMPFVLAPNLWRKLSALSQRKQTLSERAHGDRILISADSPESLDEVFWRTFDAFYVKKDCLVPHAPPKSVRQKYASYVRAILSAQDGDAYLYLCKNNNNILRLDAIRETFPNAMLLIPFRDPLAQAFSLLRQHRRFSEIQRHSKFTLAYMTWLGHHEFGLGHRPFRFAPSESERYDTNAIEYWLQLWCRTYSWLARTKPDSAIFVRYEELCCDPKMWSRLAELANIPAGPEPGEPFKLADHVIPTPANRDLIEQAYGIHERLTALSHAAFAALPKYPSTSATFCPSRVRVPSSTA